MNPACDGDFLVDVCGSQLATAMGLVHCAPPKIFKHKGHEVLKGLVPAQVEESFQTFLVPLVTFVFKSRQYKSPFAFALGDWFPFRTYLLSSKASPNDTRGIVIIVIIIVIGEAKAVFHVGGHYSTKTLFG
jgi:hypothetical protein